MAFPQRGAVQPRPPSRPALTLAFDTLQPAPVLLKLRVADVQDAACDARNDIAIQHQTLRCTRVVLSRNIAAPEEAFGLIKTSDPDRMEIVQSGFDKKDLLAAA